MKHCCTPGRGGAVPVADVSPGARPGESPGGAACKLPLIHPLIHLQAGEFLMGSDSPDAVAGDGEGPARRVTLSPYAIGATTVTNRQFGEFVRATRFVTDAERLGGSFVFHLQMPGERRDQSRPPAGGLPWWRVVAHACWQRPEGPGSHVHLRPDHPVVQVSWRDAKAYCDWAGVRLPTEAQWENAARGGLAGKRFAWGDDLCSDGLPRCNVWRGEFPHAPAAGWDPGPMPAGSGEPNGFGLHHVCGNVWEWCEDAYHPDYHRLTSSSDPVCDRSSGLRSLRGGSFLCHDSYCNRYRVSARHSNTPESAASNIGFRIAV